MRSEISGLLHRSAVFLPGEPARTGRIALWPVDGEFLDAARVSAETAARTGDDAGGVQGGVQEVTVVTSDLRRTPVTALVLPVAEALPLLTRARAAAAAAEAQADSDGSGDTGPSGAAFWGAAALLALRFAAQGRLLPGLSPAGHDAWRIGPLEAADLDEVRELAAAMPPGAHCLPLDVDGPPRLPTPEPLLRAFLDAVADTLPRSPAAAEAAGGPAFAARPPRLHPELRDWAAEVAAGHDAGVRISLRIELDRPLDPTLAPTLDRPLDQGSGLAAARAAARSPAFRAVLQMHSLGDSALVADAADVWAGAGAAAAAFPPGARLDALRALRRAARLWPPLAPLLGAAVPDSVDLADERSPSCSAEPPTRSPPTGSRCTGRAGSPAA